MPLSRLFLVKVFKQNKKLFVLFCVFVFLCFYFNFKGVETTPFFIWAMYAGKMTPKEKHRIITVMYNDDQSFNLPHTFQEPKSMMIYFTINHYRKIEANNMIDPMDNVLTAVLPHYPFMKPFSEKLLSQPGDNARYLQWLKTYLQSIVAVPVNNVTVYERLVHFNDEGRVIEDSSKILYSIQ
ncbi:MAG: hypothetical protein ABIQ31_14410 [Ferruginibacter sp.]